MKPAIVDDLLTQVSYLRIEVVDQASSHVPSADWLTAADLIGDPARAYESIAETQPGRGAPDMAVAASLWFQSYAFRVAIPSAGPYFLGREGLTADPAAVLIALTRHRPGKVAVTEAATRTRDVGDLVADLFDAHLAPMVDAITSVVTVGRRLLWGNAAASIATLARALESSPGIDRQAVRQRAAALVAAPQLQGLGHFDTLEVDGRDGWWWTRTNCCLWDRCEGGGRCNDCSLIPAAELQARRYEELTAVPT